MLLPVLKNSTEGFSILERETHGSTRFAPVHPGQIILIPWYREQYIRNTVTGDLVFLCIIIPKWQAADEKLA